MSWRRYRRVALGVTRRNLKVFFGKPAFILPAVLFPLFFFTAFAGGLSGVQNIPGFDFKGGYTAFQFVFVLLQSAAFGGVFTGLSIARDFESGFGRRMMLATPHRSAIIVGYWLAALVRASTIWTLLFGVALATGMQVGGDGVDLFGLIGLALIVNFAGIMYTSGIALRFRSIQAGPMMQTPTFLALFLAPVYVPVDLLEGWIHAVAQVNPVTALLEAGRSLIAGDPSGVGLAFGVAAGLALLFALWSLRGLRKAEAAGG
jgi:ABC-type multidrug transport system permease subunit